MKKAEKPIVVLIHGIWTRAGVMRFLARFFRRAGYDVINFSYRTVRRSPEANVLALHQAITSLNGKSFSIVAHSLGGLIATQYIRQYHPENLRRVLMLGSPLQGSKAAQTLNRSSIGRTMLGRSADILVNGVTPLEGYDIGLISGESPLGLGRLVTNLEKPCDGAVSVSETCAPWLTQHVVMRSSHTGMLFSPHVASRAVQFLKTGQL
ncbi:MAG: alpha/beta hydrolase [Gammaproteobacteria bacterium]|nr:alpha/beta hydrolase [Gammaproteobacteria bacterium]